MKDVWLIMGYLAESINRRGGSGRRTSKIQMNTGLSDQRLAVALAKAEAAGLISFDLFEDIGFVYAVPYWAEK